MIGPVLPALREKHFIEALRRLSINTHTSPAARIVESKLVRRLHVDYLARDGGDGSGSLHLGILAILLGCTKLAIVDDPRLRFQYAEYVVREWLGTHPRHLVLQPEDRSSLEAVISSIRLVPPHLNPEPSGATLQALATIETALFNFDEFTDLAVRFGEPSHAPGRPLLELRETLNPAASAPVRAFVACAMTESAAPTEALVEWSQKVASILEDYGIVAFVPIGERNPRVDRTGANDPRLYDLDLAMVAYSDVVIIRAHPAATGLGVVSELASRFATTRIIVTDSGVTITPMLAGAHPTPIMVENNPSFETTLRHTIEALLPTLRQHRNRRREKAQDAIAWLRELERRLADLTDAELNADRPEIPDREYLRAIRSDPALVAGLTNTERQALDEIGSDTRNPANISSHLTLDELRKLFEGEAQGYWRRDVTPKLVAAAAAELKEHFRSNAGLRSKFLSVAGWMALRDRLGL